MLKFATCATNSRYADSISCNSNSFACMRCEKLYATRMQCLVAQSSWRIMHAKLLLLQLMLSAYLLLCILQVIT